MAKSKVDVSTGEIVRMYNGRPHLRPVVDASKDGRTKSEFAKSCDLKARIKVYQDRGILPGMRSPAISAGPDGKPVYNEALFKDLSAVPDNYHDALNLVARVGEHFASLPSEVRSKFHNDPALYLADMEQRQKASLEAASKAANLAREAYQYDLETKVSAGRSKAAARDQRVKEAMKEPPVSPPKEG